MKHFKFKAIIAIAVLGGAVYAYSKYGGSWNLPSFEEIKDSIMEKWQVVSGMEKPHYSLDEESGFSDKYEIIEGSLAYSTVALPEEFTAQGVQKLQLDAAGCVVKLVPSTDADFHIEAVAGRKLQYYVEKATLYITVTGGITSGTGITDGVKNTMFTLYCPANTLQISVEAKLGAGSMEFGELNAQYVDLTCGAGRMTVEKLDADELKIDVDAGAVSVAEAKTGKVKTETGMGTLTIGSLLFDEGSVSCSMGNVDITVKGEEEDHDYTVKAAGVVTIGEQEFKGITGEKKIENKAGKRLKIDCSVGNVTIRFAP